MKKISLSIIAILFATATVFATGTTDKNVKKTKQETCANCTKTKCDKDCADKVGCDKTGCKDAASCDKSKDCAKMSCGQ